MTTTLRCEVNVCPPSHPCPYGPRIARAQTYKYGKYTTESGQKQTSKRCFHRVRQQFFPAVERGAPPELKDTCKPREALLARRSPAAGLRRRQCPLKAITAAITALYGRTASGATRRAPRPTLIHQPSGVWPAALTIATMPARSASGRPGPAEMTAARSGQDGPISAARAPSKAARRSGGCAEVLVCAAVASGVQRPSKP